jgi:DNA primase small subunit
MDIGAVFNMPPKDHTTVKAGAFKPVERELVFDIDLTDYDEVRTCCSKANICGRCWGFMTMAIKVMDKGLRDDFGFKDLLWIYSGRRGVHCWVCDDDARSLSNEARTAVAHYFGSGLIGSDKQTGSKVCRRRTFSLRPTS